MLGLLTKDCLLVFHRKSTIAAFVAVAAIFEMTNGGAFMVTYLMFFAAMMSAGTISYDEFDNGYAFLMTLPTGIRKYCISKYLFGGAFCALCWLVGVVISTAISFFRGGAGSSVELLLESLAMLPIGAFILDMMIPIQLKYGAQKSRPVLIVICGAIYGAGWAIALVMETTMQSSALAERLGQFSDSTYLVALFLLAVAVTVISIRASIHVMEHKDY